MEAIGYVRVSTEEQATEGVSLAAQRETVAAYCTAHGLELVEIVEDCGVSGTVPLSERPNSQRLVKPKADHVVAIRLDRLFRDAADALATTKAWDKAGVALHLIDLGGQSMNTASAMGRMMLTMMAGFAEMERSLIAERTRAALSHKKAIGEVYGRLPYGYDDQEGRLVPLDDEQIVVSEIKQMRNAKMTYRAIASELNERGIIGKRGGQFYASTIRGIVQNSLHT
jgi:site-specific DNA recombinase